MTDKPNASERQDDELRAAVKKMLQGDLHVLGLTVEQIEDLKNFFEMHTGMKAEEYGGSFLDNLVRQNASLTAEVAELKAELLNFSDRYKSVQLANKEMSRNDHVCFGDLLIERNELRAEVEKLKEADESNSADTWREQAGRLAEALAKIRSGLTTQQDKVEFYTKREAQEALADFFTIQDSDINIGQGARIGISLTRANQLLRERGKAVYSDHEFKWFEYPLSLSDTHQALLICIEPIKQGTEERKVLRELIEWKEWDGVPDGVGKCNGKQTLFEIRERARKILG